MSGLSSYCDKKINIQIKKCADGDFVYNLQRLPTCFTGYCFGNNTPCAKPNPCEPGNSVLMQVNGDRSLSCSGKTLLHCDNTLKETWYKVTSQGQPLKMPTFCVRQNHCGTQFPIWMNGSEPSIIEKVVTRKACVTNGNVCNCEKSYEISVRNCTNFLAYKLKSTSVCPERYCFGTQGKCFKDKKEASVSEFEDEDDKQLQIRSEVQEGFIHLICFPPLVLKAGYKCGGNQK
ncbi:von Willebrand factor D and EGF domain-containing protein-like [Saccostrea echinata]|uniref:von Willebrand factor D and EGF domain-containing protein-like n=1 Tax=Saccostrea echinata TaxID=191078 RepID=UPI002A841066|nr:von Willebrand factor D and EGF domain-containing protein-like [Saccostrea echinata]